MRDDEDREDYEVGYRKPPKSGQFKKGASGNPSGRPKKPSGIGSLQRELNLPLVITENGERKVITKRDGIKKQLVNKALTENIRAICEARIWDQQDLEKAAEEEKQAQFVANRTTADMTDDELWALAIADLKKSTSAEQMAEMLKNVAQMLNITKPELFGLPPIDPE